MKTDMLYKRDSKGEIRYWFAEADGDKWRSESGRVGGSPVAPEWTTAKPKNVGRANETTAEQQAMIEAEAAFNKKLKRDYFRDINDVDNKQMLCPMLAEKLDEQYPEHNLPYHETFSQPKLDGFRANTKPEGFFSRKNEPFLNVAHLTRVLEIAMFEGIHLDGELYNHDLKDDFDSLQSLVMTKKPTAEDRENAERVVQFHIYDIMLKDDVFSIRHSKVLELFKKWPELNKHCVIVPTVSVASKVDLDRIYLEYLDAGYEGQMVRINRTYENKKSKFLLKRKEFEDEEYEIVEVYEGKGNRSGMAGGITCLLPDGRTFGAGLKGGVAYYKRLWAERDSLVGKLATVNRAKQLTPDGMPRFPVFKSVREDI